MPRRRTNEREQVRTEQFAHALSDILHELHISHRDLAAALHISRYTVDSWTRVADPALPSDQNLVPLCQFIEQRQRGSGAKLAAVAQCTWVPTNNEKAITSVSPSANASRHNLPAALTSFVGRDTELREVAHLLTVTRLLTLTGVGGVGKTRLALQLAQKNKDDFADGVWLIELAALRDPNLVWPAIAAAVGAPGPVGDNNHQLLTAYLHSKHLLLVLDNCEHLVGGCAQAAMALLQACPHLRVLTTSREGLGIAGEVLYHVLPLTPPRSVANVARWTGNIAHSDAVRLFVERACAVQPTFALSEHNAQAVTHICQRLDGIPLALELAAARVRHLSPEQIAERLKDRFGLLTGGSRTALPRQQTLRAALDWSHDLLSDAERVLFRRLSVFAGGWSLAAAEQVTAHPADVGHSRALIGRNDVADLLSALIDKSLVVVDARAGEARYHVLETVRAYAHEKCTVAGEVEAMCDAHLSFFHRFVLNVKPLLYGAEQLHGFERLDHELKNIRAALEWALTTQPMTLIEMADALQLYWQFWGSASEGFRWVKAASGHAATLPSVDGVRVHANISRVLAELARMQGENGLADAMSAQAVALYRTLNDPTGLGIALCTYAFNTSEANQFEVARAAAEEAITLLRVCDDQFHLSYAFGMLAVSLAALDEFGMAYQALQESTRSARAAGAPLVLSMALLSSAFVDVQRGEHARARTPLEEAIMLFQATRNHHMLHVARSLLADIARQRGDVRDAEALYHQVIGGWRERGQFGALARCIECLGFIAHAEGKHTRAVRLFVAAADVRASTQAAMTEPEESEYTEHMQQLRMELGATDFEAAWGTVKR
jgi:non-specific serine/threonine protein kinase